MLILLSASQTLKIDELLRGFLIANRGLTYSETQTAIRLVREMAREVCPEHLIAIDPKHAVKLEQGAVYLTNMHGYVMCFHNDATGKLQLVQLNNGTLWLVNDTPEDLAFHGLIRQTISLADFITGTQFCNGAPPEHYHNKAKLRHDL